MLPFHLQGRDFMKICIITLIFLLSACAANITTDSFIYQDDKVEAQLDLKQIKSTMTHEAALIQLSELSVKTAQGVVLKGVKLTHKNALINIIFFGGSGMKISSSFGILDKFAELPANVIWFDYRGAGVSEKKNELTVLNLQEDALKVFDFSNENFSGKLPTLVHGISMGSVLAGYVATERAIDGLILDSAVSSIPELVDNLVPSWSKLFSTVTVAPELAKVDNTKLIEKYNGPLLILIGDDDSMTPVKFSQKLYDASGSTVKKLTIILDAKHGKPMKKEQAIEAYKLFIEKLLCCNKSSKQLIGRIN